MREEQGTDIGEAAKETRQAPVVKQAERENLAGPASNAAPASPRRTKEGDREEAADKDKVEQGEARPFPSISEWFERDPGAEPDARARDVIRYASLCLPHILHWIHANHLEGEAQFESKVTDLILEAHDLVNLAEDHLQANPREAIIKLRMAIRKLENILHQLKAAGGESGAAKTREVYKHIAYFHRRLEPVAEQLAREALPASTGPKRKQSMPSGFSLPGFLTPRGAPTGSSKSKESPRLASSPRASEKPTEAEASQISLPPGFVKETRDLLGEAKAFASHCQSPEGGAAVIEEGTRATRWNLKIRSLRDAIGKLKALLADDNLDARSIVIQLRSVENAVERISKIIEKNSTRESEKSGHDLLKAATKIMKRAKSLIEQAAGVVIFNTKIAGSAANGKEKPVANAGRSGHLRHVSTSEIGTLPVSPMTARPDRPVEAISPRSPRPTLTRIPGSRKLPHAVSPVSPVKAKRNVSAPPSPMDSPVPAPIATTLYQPTILPAESVAEAAPRTPAPARGGVALNLKAPPTPRRLVPLLNLPGQEQQAKPDVAPSSGQEKPSSGSASQTSASSGNSGSGSGSGERG
jgi:hypothetical protein